jgi:hypothetical protein
VPTVGRKVVRDLRCHTRRYASTASPESSMPFELVDNLVRVKDFAGRVLWVNVFSHGVNVLW